MYWLLIWMMLFSTSDDPSAASPSVALNVNGSRLPENRLAFVVMPGDSVTLTVQDENTGWSATEGYPSSGSGSLFGWRAPRGHGIFHIDVSSGDAIQSFAVIVPVESCRC